MISNIYNRGRSELTPKQQKQNERDYTLKMEARTKVRIINLAELDPEEDGFLISLIEQAIIKRNKRWDFERGEMNGK
ncbi:MAG: hypothetical protein COB08_019410 [Rhodobacteraceae bacterium]|nr:hypothetical protein [Paracoccaceae bacterium]